MAPTPDWASVRDITQDLQYIIDKSDTPEDFRPKLARTIAQLRDEKQYEGILENGKEVNRILYRQLV